MKNLPKLLLGVLALIVLASCTFDPGGNRFVFDDEKILDADHLEIMENNLSSLYNNWGIEILLITTDNYAVYENIEDYAHYVATSMNVGGEDNLYGLVAVFSKSMNEFLIYSPRSDSKFLTQKHIDEIMLPELSEKIKKFESKEIEFGMRRAVDYGRTYWLENVYKEIWVIDEIELLSVEQIDAFNKKIEEFNELTDTHFVFIISNDLRGYPDGYTYWMRGLANHTVMRAGKQMSGVHFDVIRPEEGWVGTYPGYQDDWSWEIFEKEIYPDVMAATNNGDWTYEAAEIAVDRSLEYLKEVYKDRIKNK